jgi:hypothetical protein
MRAAILASAGLAFAVAACGTAQLESGNEMPMPPAGAAADIVPVGTEFTVELDATLNAENSDVGDRFTATVKDDINDGATVIVPEGSKVTGRITGVDEADGVTDQAAVRVVFESINVNGVEHALAADITDVDVSLTDRRNVGDTIEKVGAGAAAGAVVGAIIGGSLKDILVGGALGAGAGTIISLGTGDQQNSLPAGSELDLRVTQRVAMSSR